MGCEVMLGEWQILFLKGMLNGLCWNARSLVDTTFKGSAEWAVTC